MKFLHFANWNSTNIGNGALALGAERVLREDLGPETEFVREAWDDYTFGLKKFDEQFVALINQHDVLLVNGAVTLNSFRRRMFNTGFRFDLPIALWDAIQVPIVFYGISYMNFAGQPYPNARIFKKTLEYILANDNVLFAVRNDGTKEWIEKTFGLHSDRIYEIPDTGLYVPAAQEIEYPELNPKKKNVIIAFNNESEVYRYGGSLRLVSWNLFVWFLGDERMEKWFKKLPLHVWGREKVVKKLAHAMELLVQKQPTVQFILAPHYLDDYRMIGDLIAVLPERIAHQLTVSTGLLKTTATEYFYGRYAKADLALAMRIHSMSPSIGLNVPVIPLTYAGRMGHFLKLAGLGGIEISLFSDFPKRLAERADELLTDPTSLKHEMKESVRRMREQTKVFNTDILTPFLKRG